MAKRVLSTEFNTRLVGVAFRNPGGTRRQDIIRKCIVGEDVLLVHEPVRHLDDNIMAVRRRKAGKPKIGYLPSGIAAKILMLADDGKEFAVEITDIIGDDPNYEVVIRIQVYEPAN